MSDRKIVNLLIAAKLLSNNCLLRILFRSPTCDGGLCLVKLFFKKFFTGPNFIIDEPTILIVPVYSLASWRYRDNTLVSCEENLKDIYKKIEYDDSISFELKEKFKQMIPKIEKRLCVDEYILYVLDSSIGDPVPFTGGEFQNIPSTERQTILDLNSVTILMKQFQTILLRHQYISLPGFSSYDFLWDGNKFIFIGFSKLALLLERTLNTAVMSTRPFQDRMFTSKWSIAKNQKTLSYLHTQENLPSFLIHSFTSTPQEKIENAHDVHLREVIHHTKGRCAYKDVIVKGKESASVFSPRTILVSKETYDTEESLFISQHISALFSNIISIIMFPLNSFKETNYRSRVVDCPACLKNDTYASSRCCIPRVLPNTQKGKDIHGFVCVNLVSILQNMFKLNPQSTPSTCEEISSELFTIWDELKKEYVDENKTSLFIHSLISTTSLALSKEGLQYV